MAKKEKAPKAPKEKKPKLVQVDVDKALIDNAKRLLALEKQVVELKGDLRRLAELLSKQFGGEFAAQALDIVNREQGA